MSAVACQIAQRLWNAQRLHANQFEIAEGEAALSVKRMCPVAPSIPAKQRRSLFRDSKKTACFASQGPVQKPMLGYLYQARCALALLLSGIEEEELVLESLDDIVLQEMRADTK